MVTTRGFRDVIEIRRHGVILDWGTGELLPKTTEGFRAMLKRRVVPH
jgi:N-methylhydantoinase B